MLVISMDPGRKVSFMAGFMDDSRFQVVAWGKVMIDSTRNFQPDSVLRNKWEANCMFPEPTCLAELISRFDGAATFVWEQQRGSLEWSVGEPFVAYIKSLGYAIDRTPPNEKFYRLGITKDKRQSIAYAAEYFQEACSELSDFLQGHPVGQVHDIADACLLAIMWLQEQHSVPLPKSPPLAESSGCHVASTLASIYRAINVNGRKGSNIARHMEVTARIAGSRAIFVRHPGPGSYVQLTRRLLRGQGVPSSEAADLRQFAEAVVTFIQHPFGGVSLDFNGLSLTIYKAKGNRNSASAVIPRDMKEAFMSVLIGRCGQRVSGSKCKAGNFS